MPRILSALALAGVGLFVTWLGGWPFNVFTALVASIMVWELGRMFEAGQAALWLAIGAGSALVIASALDAAAGLPVILVFAIAGLGFVSRLKAVFALFILALLLASYGVITLRENAGFHWMIWFAGVVIASDVGGYFAGRIVGGPKIWPSLSPKKTWSGTVAGWIGAALVSLPFVAMGAGWGVVIIGAVLAFAAQLGDLFESAVKRRVGVKDASGIMPGHGGLLDRFDSMMGASLVLFGIGLLVEFPPAAGP